MPEEKYINKKCKKHGTTSFVLEGRGYYRCKKCRVEQVSKRRKTVTHLIKNEHGGKCNICGYNKCIEALEFHHKERKDKKFLVSKGLTYGIDKLRFEASKCILLCANCHREVEAGITNIPK
jgi:hypothetical protein